ncbi:MAG: hypothetical protein GTO13_18345, partial [Proteobacteria bacterium]|nr:hypothetical protein [Pseudomonadota bacterium]
LTLAWDPNTESDLAGYRVYYGIQSSDYDFVVDTGDVTQYKLRGLKPDTQYYFALTAYDTSGNESDFSAEVGAITDNEPVSGSSFTANGGGSGGGCFVATAAYGSYLNPHVKTLRGFRDEFLTSNSLGRKFVHFYYRYGPLMANQVKKHGFSQFLTRQALLPLIGMSLLSLKATASQKFFLLPLCLLFIFTFTVALRLHLRQAR